MKKTLSTLLLLVSTATFGASISADCPETNSKIRDFGFKLSERVMSDRTFTDSRTLGLAISGIGVNREWHESDIEKICEEAEISLEAIKETYNKL